MKIIWQEFKLLDKSTNSSTRIQMINQLMNLGNEVEYYCSYRFGKKYYNLNNEIIRYLSITRIPKVRSLIFFARLFFSNLRIALFSKADIVIIDYMVVLVAWPAIALAKMLEKGAKYVMDIRTLPVNMSKYRWQIKIFRLSFWIANNLCAGITFITPFMRKYLIENGKAKRPSAIWSSGFNRAIFDPSRYGNSNRDNHLFQLFYHGGLSVSRGVLELIKASKILHDGGYNIELRLIGNVVDEDAITGYIDESKMKGYCSVERPVPYEDVPELIAESDLPVIPLSSFIGWRVSSPLKLMEYLAMGKSVVVTDIEAHRDVIGKAKFAFYARSEKAEDIADAIKIAYRNKEFLNEYGEDARELALGNYTWEKQAENLLQFLRTL